MSDDIREALEGAFEGEETGNEPVENRQEQVAEPPEDPPSEGENTHTEPVAGEDKPIRDYLRDEKGKFAPKEAENAQIDTKPPEEGVKAGPKVGQPPVSGEKPVKDPLARAPEAWKPEAREHWKDIPEGAKAEIIRHNQLVYDTLNRTSEERKFAQAVQKTVAPFEHLIKAEGGDTVRAIDSLLSTAALLRTGTADQIAQLVGQLTQQYGVGRFGNQFIEKLDNALVGNAPKDENPEVAALRQQYEREMAPLRQMQQQMMQQQQMTMQQSQMEAEQEIERFSEQAEFLNDVRMEMADIINMGAQRGMNYTLQQAYDIACKAHPEISKVLAQREHAKTAQSLSQTAQRARAAAVSVGGAPSLGGGDDVPSDSIRNALEFAMSRAGG